MVAIAIVVIVVVVVVVIIVVDVAVVIIVASAVVVAVVGDISNWNYGILFVDWGQWSWCCRWSRCVFHSCFWNFRII